MKRIKNLLSTLLLVYCTLVPFLWAEENSVAEADDVLADLAKAQAVSSAPAASRKEASVRNDITNLEFKMEGDNSRILLSSSTELAYRENHNAGLKQFVYLFQNTGCSQRLQRAYDTTEFLSPVAYFTLLQLPDAKAPTCKLIVQMRDSKTPTLTSTDRGLYIDFPAPDEKFASRELTSDPSKVSQTESNPYNGDTVYAGKPIDLELKNSDIQDVLRLIGRSSGYNVVVGDDVQGKLGTLSLHGIPWDQALALVLQSKKLGYVRQGNVLRIATLANIKSERDEAAAAELSQIKAEPIRTVLIPISYATATDLAARLKTLLSERGTVDTDARTNTIILRDVDRVVTRVQKMISVLDTQPPRVTVSAKFVEMTKGFTRSLGISGAAVAGATGGARFNAPMLGVNSASSLSVTPVGGPFTTTLTAPAFSDISATIAIGEHEDNARELANPTITINSNQQGKVSAGRTTQRLESGPNGTATIVTITANLDLNITPIVSSDGSISMTVALNNDTFVPGTTDKKTRSINTNILVGDGDTAVLGGVFSDSLLDVSEGIPILRKIPILGLLFGGTESTHSRSEIMIFLTAKITNPDESFRKPL